MPTRIVQVDAVEYGDLVLLAVKKGENWRLASVLYSGEVNTDTKFAEWLLNQQEIAGGVSATKRQEWTITYHLDGDDIVIDDVSKVQLPQDVSEDDIETNVPTWLKGDAATARAYIAGLATNAEVKAAVGEIAGAAADLINIATNEIGSKGWWSAVGLRYILNK